MDGDSIMSKKLKTEYVCRQCGYYIGDKCDNKKSDHYGHMLWPYHPACEGSTLTKHVKRLTGYGKIGTIGGALTPSDTKRN